ncbi:MAG: hypothetical protein ACFFFC_09450 [Candidatus Thorarchaeota archaeon]
MIVVYLMVLGILIGLAFYSYIRFIRASDRPSYQPTEVSTMIGGRVEHITTGAVPKLMPRHLMSESERDEE